MIQEFFNGKEPCKSFNPTDGGLRRDGAGGDPHGQELLEGHVPRGRRRRHDETHRAVCRSSMPTSSLSPCCVAEVLEVLSEVMSFRDITSSRRAIRSTRFLS